MKINTIPSIIAVVLCAIIMYGMYTWCKCTDMRLLVSILGGICLVLPLGSTLGVQFSDSRVSVNVKILSAICFAILLISQIIFCCLSAFSAATYIIINGLLLMLWLLSAYGIVKAS